MLSLIPRKIDRLLFPALCRHCGASFRDGLSNILCRSCLDSVVPDHDPRCRRCGLPFPPGAFEGSENLRCLDCGDLESPLDEVRSFSTYEGAIRLAHHFFKFEGMPGLAGDLAGRMARALPRDGSWGGSVLVPVPLSPERERERGYNPALLLAREVSRIAALPVLEALVKVRSTRPQMKLDRSERRTNPRGAYAIRDGEDVPDRIVLVDDVMTTGSTLEECARVLRNKGCVSVRALLLGRTPQIS